MDSLSPQTFVYKKTKLCAFASYGKCHHGRGCFYAHDIKELQSAPDLRKSTLCINHNRGRCYTKDCKFAHGHDELRVPLVFPSRTESDTDPTWQYEPNEPSQKMSLQQWTNFNTMHYNRENSQNTDNPVVVISINKALSQTRRPLSLFGSLSCDEVDSNKEANALLSCISKEVTVSPNRLSLSDSLGDDEGDSSPWRLPR